MVRPVTLFSRFRLLPALACLLAPSAVNAIVTGAKSAPDRACEAPCCVPYYVKEYAASVEFLSFAIPEEKLRNQTGQKKKRMLSNLIAGNGFTYRYRSEKRYYDQYAESFFGHTKKKLGWDCMRHYEIIAAGAVPLFEDLASMPECVAARLPRDMLRRGQALFDQAGELDMGSEPIFDEEKMLQRLPAQWTTAYNELQGELMSYAKANLTTRELAKQWATSTGLPQGGKVLWLFSFFHGEKQPQQPFCHSDYGRDTLFHGLRQSGISVVDVPRLDFLYQDNPCTKLYGRGFSYSGLLPAEDPDIASARLNWKDILAAGGFDHVIFSTSSSMFWYPAEFFGPNFGDVEKGLGHDSKKVSFVIGNDNLLGPEYHGMYPRFLRQGHIFVREGFRHSR